MIDSPIAFFRGRRHREIMAGLTPMTDFDKRARCSSRGEKYKPTGEFRSSVFWLEGSPGQSRDDCAGGTGNARRRLQLIPQNRLIFFLSFEPAEQFGEMIEDETNDSTMKRCACEKTDFGNVPGFGISG